MLQVNKDGDDEVALEACEFWYLLSTWDAFYVKRIFFFLISVVTFGFFLIFITAICLLLANLSANGLQVCILRCSVAS